METYLTVSELAAALKLREQTIRRYIVRRAIPYCKILRAVRFRPSEIEKWIDGGGLEAARKSEMKHEKDLFPEENRTEEGGAEV
ncbi:MAG: helix-turn-helix domain-containing protein [Treponema sp.]|nr:helix-turn-helix domain-containing protein [Treponema sp.]